MLNKFHVKIGDIEFALEGNEDYIKRERSVFFESVLLQAVDAMTRVRMVQVTESQGNSENYEKTETQKLPESQNIENKYLIDELSINEFLNQKGFASQIDTALGLIYYFENYCKQSEFSSECIKTYFQKAKIIVPQNPSDIVQKLNQKGFIQPTDNPKQYTITRSGSNHIDQYQKKDSKISKRKKARSKTPSAYETLTREDLNLDKYPPTNSLKNFKDKMMIALYIVTNEEKGKSFTTADVMHIMTDIFGEKATINQVNGIFGRNPRWFNETLDAENKKLVRRGLLNEGLNYAKVLINK